MWSTTRDRSHSKPKKSKTHNTSKKSKKTSTKNSVGRRKNKTRAWLRWSSNTTSSSKEQKWYSTCCTRPRNAYLHQKGSPKKVSMCYSRSGFSSGLIGIRKPRSCSNGRCNLRSIMGGRLKRWWRWKRPWRSLFLSLRCFLILFFQIISKSKRRTKEKCQQFQWN